MAADPVVFAMANLVLEIQPEEAEGVVRVMAAERSDQSTLDKALVRKGIRARAAPPLTFHTRQSA